MKNIDNISFNIKDLCMGTIQKRYLTCGYKKCSCHSSPSKKHGPFYYLVFTNKPSNKPITKYLPAEMIPIIKEKIKNYHKLQKYIAQYIKKELKINKRRRRYGKI